tara:strand:+ start:111 stop:449 length:339 start_codon:yes stop_codon:yes gene_type:complete
MRLIEKEMNIAIKGGTDFFKSNTSVETYTTEAGKKESCVKLHGNHIATVGETFVTIYDGGWQTPTTKSRLNAIINEFCNAYTDGVFQKNYEWFINTANGTVDFVNGFTFGDA